MIHLNELRVRLDQMTERIVSRLKDRSRFPLNEAVYRPDAVPIRGRSGLSFLEFALEGLETYHASLGRYDYPDQHHMSSGELPASRVERVIGRTAVATLTVSVKGDLIMFYQGLLRRMRLEGDDPDTYGETVYIDSDLLSLLNERIHLGTYIAQAKVSIDPSVLTVVRDTERLTAKLRDPGREKMLIRASRSIAVRYELDPDVVEAVFSWIIGKTLAVEVAYLRDLPK